MADNTTITPGTGVTVAADDIGAGVLAQRVKPVWGPDGTGNDIDVATGKPLPVQIRSATGLIPVGEPTDAAATQTDTTSVSIISILKQISKSIQLFIFGTGTAAAALRTTLATDVGLPAGTSLLGKIKTKFIAAAGSAMTRVANTTAYVAGYSISNNVTAGSVTANVITVSDVNDDTITIERFRITSTDTGIATHSVRVWLYNSDPTANSGVQAGDGAAFSNKRAGFIGTMSGTFRAMQDGSVAVCVPDEGARIIAVPASGAKTIWWQLQALDAFTPVSASTFTPTVEGFQGAA